MFFDQILKYIIPESATALQRVAVRQAAIFLCAIGIAFVLAFGEDTFSILSYWVGRFAGMEQADVPQTAATLSLAALVLLYLVAWFFYSIRNGLVRLWSGCWWPFPSGGNPRWLFSIIESFISDVEDKEQRAKK